MNEKQKQQRCPVCGRFISEKLNERKETVAAKLWRANNDLTLANKTLSDTLLKKNKELEQIKNENQRLSNMFTDALTKKGVAEAKEAALNDVNYKLKAQNAALTANVNRLKSRGLFARILNKD